MGEVKLTRWATYLVPGSIVVFGVYVSLHSLLPENISQLMASSDTPWLAVFVFSVISYVVGIGLWGVCYSGPVQKTLFLDPHRRRECMARGFLTEAYRRQQYFRRLKEFFPEVPEDKKDPKNFEYRDFQFIILSIYERASDATKERVISTRDTIGLLQSLILSCVFLCVIFLIHVFVRVRNVGWLSARPFVVGVLLSICVLPMLYVHYRRRNVYFVRDVMMAFLAGTEGQTE